MDVTNKLYEMEKIIQDMKRNVINEPKNNNKKDFSNKVRQKVKNIAYSKISYNATKARANYIINTYPDEEFKNKMLYIDSVNNRIAFVYNLLYKQMEIKFGSNIFEGKTKSESKLNIIYNNLDYKHYFINIINKLSIV